MARSGRATLFTSIGANARAGRIAMGLTQEELAEAVQLVPRYIAQIEHGKANLTVGVLADIAERIGVEPWALLRPTKPEPRKVGRPPGRKTTPKKKS